MEKLPPAKQCRTLWTAGLLLAALMTGCTKESSETSREQTGEPMVRLQYTVSRTSIIEGDGAMTSSPAISREAVNLKIYGNSDFTMRVDLLDQADESFYQSELIPGNDYPEAAYYEMTPGHYQVFDAEGELITQNEMPELDFSELVRQLKESPQLHTARIMTGGLFFWQEKSDDPSAGNSRLQNYHNPYEDDPNYTVHRSVVEDMGTSYIQEAVVLNENNTVKLMAVYDMDYHLIGKTSFRYEGEGEALQLKNTHETRVEKNEAGDELIHTTLATFDQFHFQYNL